MLRVEAIFADGERPAHEGLGYKARPKFAWTAPDRARAAPAQHVRTQIAQAAVPEVFNWIKWYFRNWPCLLNGHISGYSAGSG
jgi:hypothetical protein